MLPQGKMAAGGMKMYSIREKIRQILRSPCPLCGLMAVGGDLCLACENKVRFDFDVRHHCPRCLYQAPVAPSVADTIQASATDTSSVGLCATCTQRAGTDTPAYSRAVAGIYFAPPGDQLMRCFKAQGRLTDAGLFARLLWRNMRTVKPPLPRLEALVPIPSSRDAILKRGMNPAGEIARELAGLSGIPLRGEWLRRTRETTSQKSLDLRSRQESVRGLYAVPVRLGSRWVGLVDDVLTTGSTLEQASGELLRAGASGVVALVAARTLAK